MVRWTTPDPLGMVDGPNVYAYVGGQVIILVDPYGLWGWGYMDAIVIIGGTVATAVCGTLAGVPAAITGVVILGGATIYVIWRAPHQIEDATSRIPQIDPDPCLPDDREPCREAWRAMQPNPQ